MLFKSPNQSTCHDENLQTLEGFQHFLLCFPFEQIMLIVPYSTGILKWPERLSDEIYLGMIYKLEGLGIYHFLIVGASESN